MGLAAAFLAVSVLLSRLLGYVRDAVLAATLGASAETDAYYAAFGLPDLLLYFLAGGALSIAFVPVFSRALVEGREDDGWRLFSNISTTGALILLPALCVAWLKAPTLLKLLLPEFDAEQIALTTRLTRIILPGPFFFFIGGLIGATEMSRKRFQSTSLAPLIYNLCVILGGVLLGPKLGAEGFAWGVLAGALLGPFGANVWFARKTLRYRPFVSLKSNALRRYAIIALPLMVGVSLTTIDEWLARYFASGMPEGTISWLNNARRLMLVPVALIGQAIGQAALPWLADLAVAGKKEELTRSLGTTVKATAALSVCAAAGLALVAEPAVAVVYGHGAYTAADVSRTASLLMIYAAAIPAWSIQAIVMRGFYAHTDTLRPMLTSTAVATLSIGIYASLAGALDARGLAAACAVGLTVQAVAAIVVLSWGHGVSIARWALGGAVLGLAAVGPGAGLWFFMRRAGCLVADVSTFQSAALNLGVAMLMVGLPAVSILVGFGGDGFERIRSKLPWG